MLSKPELSWETNGFWANKSPAVIKPGKRIFISYSASATDENYCIGLLWADINSDILDAAQWHKSPEPVFRTQYQNRQFGPGHNSFTRNEHGEDVLVYHARNYTEIEGDPLYDPNRHARIKTISWDEQDMPIFGEPPADTTAIFKMWSCWLSSLDRVIDRALAGSKHSGQYSESTGYTNAP